MTPFKLMSDDLELPKPRGRAKRPRRARAFLPLGLVASAIVVGGGPAAIAASADQFPTLSLGYSHTCAVDATSHAVCWGYNRNFLGTLTNQAVVPDSLGEVQQVEGGLFNTCALTRTGSVACWGDNSQGESAPPADLGPVAQISVGTQYACALKVDATVVCWGTQSKTAYATSDQLKNVSQISAGGGQTCAIKLDQSVTCWGLSDPVGSLQPPLGLRAVQISSGYTFHVCAVDLSSHAVCWGNNSNGQSDVPADLGTVKQVAAGNFSTCAVKTDGRVVCWGSGAAYLAPPLDLGPAKAAYPNDGVCAVLLNGRLRCWGGSNWSGQLSVPAATFPSLSGLSVDGNDGQGLDFGDVQDGTGSAVLKSNVVSTPTAFGVPVTISGAALTNDGGGAFSIVSQNCAPVQLASGAACSIGVRFSPRNGQSGLVSGSITVTDDSPAGSHTIALSGRAISVPTGAMIDFGDANGLDFGDVVGGARSPVLKSFVSTSAANPGATISSVTLGDDGNGAFSILSQSCTAAPIGHGGACVIRVRFTPKIWQRGDLSAQVTVTDDSTAGTHTIPLSGAALQPPAFILQNTTATPAPDKVDFNWETSDESKVTITIAQPVTTLVKVKKGKKTTTKKVTTVKQLPVTTIPKAIAGPGTYSWNRKIAKTPAAKGTWAWILTAKSARGTLAKTATVTLG